MADQEKKTEAPVAAAAAAPVAPPTNKAPGFPELYVTVRGAAMLPAADKNGKSDPFVRFLVNGKKLFDTQIHYKTLDPQWNYIHKSPVAIPKDALITVEVYDQDNFSKNDFLAKGEVNESHWHMIKDGKTGSQFFAMLVRVDAKFHAPADKDDKKNPFINDRMVSMGFEILDDAGKKLWKVRCAQAVTDPERLVAIAGRLHGILFLGTLVSFHSVSCSLASGKKLSLELKNKEEKTVAICEQDLAKENVVAGKKGADDVEVPWALFNDLSTTVREYEDASAIFAICDGNLLIRLGHSVVASANASKFKSEDFENVVICLPIKAVV